tara:strand:- start:26383 stop:28359 length:1977 start_codon:yes stop_codon:yes gene_type:complete
MAIKLINSLNDLPNYGVSVSRSGFTKLTDTGGIDSTGAVSGVGLMMTLASDMTASWQLYNGDSTPDNKIQLVGVGDNANTDVTKQFFNQLPINSQTYFGQANFGPVGNLRQHVLLFETTNEILPNRGSVSRGVDQSYRVRFEFDERPRLHTTDVEFNRELYQLNLRLRSMGRAQYVVGSQINETSTSQHQLETTKDADNNLVHTGYTFNGTWAVSDGIPNCMYGWMKINVGTSNQLLNNGTVLESISGNDGLITLENGSTLTTSVVRTPGELVDLHFEDVVIPAQSLVFPYDGINQYSVGEVISGPGGASATVHSVSTSSTTQSVTFSDWNNIDFDEGETITGANSSLSLSLTLVTTQINRSKRFRNKRKGKGWFKRFPKIGTNLEGTYPMSYRLTMTERGFVLYMFDDAASDQSDDYAWTCVQRTVDNTEGTTPSDESTRFPVHVLYSCSRESVYARDFGVYFSESAANLQTAETAVNSVFDNEGNQYTVDSLGNDSFYILSPYDREDSLADEFTAKLIWRFVAREFDILKPWDVHKLATKHQTDSNAIINPLEQLAITNDNRFVITFPTGLTTQRFMYPKEEIDLICFSSAEVVAEGSNVPMNTYLPSGNADNRRYQGMRSTLANGNGMRIMLLVNGRHIFNSDVNIGTDTSANLI